MKAYQFSIPDDPQIDGVLSFRRADGEVLLNAIKPLDDGGWPRVFVEPGRYQICEHFPDEEPERWRDIEFVAPDPGPCRVTVLEERVDALETLVNQLLEARHPSEAMLSQLEEVQDVLKGAVEPDQPPASIADLFQADKPLAAQAQALHDLWVQLGHQIQRGEASVDQIRKHERLSSELEFINKHAFDGI